MKSKLQTSLLLLTAIFGLGQIAISAGAQQTSKPKPKPKNEVTKVIKARKRDHTVRQVTPDPKKSPGKHTDNLSKNVNHETNRESKDFNHGLNDISKGVNHAFQGKKKQ